MKNIDRLAAKLGAERQGKVSAYSAGAFGVAKLAAELGRLLEPSYGARPGRPSNPAWKLRPKVPMAEATAARLKELAQRASTAERKVSPMQVAAELLERAAASYFVMGRSGAEDMVYPQLGEAVSGVGEGGLGAGHLVRSASASYGVRLFHLTKDSQQGNWKLQEAGKDRALRRFDTKLQALNEAPGLMRKRGVPILLRIHRQDGTVQGEKAFPGSSESKKYPE